jgi:lysophospholipase L1-like esterase
MPSPLRPDWGPYIPAEHPALRWEGRVRFRPDRAADFDWASVRVHMAFEGTVLAVYARLGPNYLDVLVDGRRVAVLGRAFTVKAVDWAGLRIAPVSTGGKPVYVIRGLSAGRHEVVIAKRTGPNFGPVRLLGMRLQGDATLLRPPPAPSRRLEFVGDSLSVGYGNEGPGRHCGQLGPYENSSLSWARQTADLVDADAQIVAVSGRGLVRNYGAPGRTSPGPMPRDYPRTLQGDSLLWDRKRFVPDLAVVLLGDNDFSTRPVPLPADFIAAYHAFLDVLRQGRPGMPILCAYMAGSAGLAQCVKSVVAEEQAKGQPVDLLPLPAVAEKNLGCDAHPNVWVHTQWAKIAASKIRKTLKW